ncbi:MAG: cell division protein FtsA [Armatimonadetes bacterium]|nr:cell division protein FtsA [Armatimonadota bacterium]
MSELVVALDIGTTKVCTLVAEVQAGGAVRLLGVGHVPCGGLRRGAVVDMAKTVEAIEASVEQAGVAAGVEIRSVLVGITGEHIASLNARGVAAVLSPDREVRRADVERVLESARLIVLPPDREIVHVLPRYFTLDGQEGIKNPVGMCGTRLEVDTHIVTGAAALLRNVSACVEKTGLTIEELILEPMASGEAVLLPAERELGVALLDIGGGTTDIALFRQGEICHSAVVPVGGTLVTRDVAAFLRTSLEEAERIKCAAGCAQPGTLSEEESLPYALLGSEEAGQGRAARRELAEVIEARCTEQMQLVKKELLRSNLFDSLPAGVVLCGGGALLPGLAELTEQLLGMPVRVGCVRTTSAQAAGLTTPSYATAFGLVQWGAKRIKPVRRLRPQGVLERFRALLAHKGLGHNF